MKIRDKARWGKDLVEDLLQRKVDTIVTDGITGRPMPHPVTALLDINNSYFRKLKRLGVIDNAAADCPAEAHDARGWLMPNVAAQQWLVGKALEGLHNPAVKGADACLVQRVVATCTALMPIVARLEKEHPKAFGSGLREAEVAESMSTAEGPPTRMYYSIDWSKPLPDIELERQERAALSKAWELGSDTVALQTIAMLDGDIITRVSEQYTGDAFATVRQIHKESVNLSLSTWELLAKGIGSIVDALFSRK